MHFVAYNLSSERERIAAIYVSNYVLALFMKMLLCIEYLPTIIFYLTVNVLILVPTYILSS